MIDRAQKVDGLMGVEMGMLIMEQALSPAQLEMFCENSSDGEALWEAFQARVNADDTAEGYGWAEFAIEVISKNAGMYLTPRSCQLPTMKDFIGAEAQREMSAAGQQMTDTELLSAHREEQPALSKMCGFLCRSCNVSGCPHYTPRESRKRRRRRRR